MGQSVEFQTRDRRVASSSLTAGGVTALCFEQDTFIRCLVLVQPRNTRPDMTEKWSAGTKIIIRKKYDKHTSLSHTECKLFN